MNHAIIIQSCSIENQKDAKLYNVYDNNTLLVLNGTSFKSINALLPLNWQYDN